MNFVPRVLATGMAALSLWSVPQVTGAQSPQRSVLRQLYGDVAVEGRTKGDGFMTLAVADSRASIVVTFLATDLRRWSDSSVRILAARPRRGSVIKWESSVEGPGTRSGSMSLSRTITATDTSIVLLVTDTTFRAIRAALSKEDAQALAGAIKRAANASLPTRPAPLPKAKSPAPRKPPVR